MNKKNSNINKKKTSKAICFGAGLLALDVIVNGNPNTQPKFLAGGSCGNVLLALSFLGWKSYPIARLSDNLSTDLVLADLQNIGVKTNLISQSNDGSTPVIIHRILKDSENKPKHRFEFKVPKTNIWFPSYKPILSSKVEEICNFPVTPKIFYLDRVSRATIDLAKKYKERGSIIFFEPSSIGDEKHFNECLQITDILKFSSDRIPQYKDLYPSRNVPIEIETLGANGLLYRCFKSKSDDWRFLPALHIDGVIDTAGAGDWCSAGMIHLIFDDFNKNALSTLTINKLEQALFFGQFLSALNCSFYGARGIMYNLKYSEIIKAYISYQNTKKIEIKKSEQVFNLSDQPFNFHILVSQ